LIEILIKFILDFLKPKTPIKPSKCYTEIEQIREKSVFVSRISYLQNIETFSLRSDFENIKMRIFASFYELNKFSFVF
jgi:hypothetical protein